MMNINLRSIFDANLDSPTAETTETADPQQEAQRQHQEPPGEVAEDPESGLPRGNSGSIPAMPSPSAIPPSSSMGSDTTANLDEALLSRHRRLTSKHAMEFERIVEDSQMQTQHAVPDLSAAMGDSKLADDPAQQSQPNWRSKIQDNEKLRRKLSPRAIFHKTRHALAGMVPIKDTLATYNCFKMKHDIIAGVTVAILAIPLGMSYARLAGLPAYFGLYGSFVPALVYPIFGTTPQLAVGPAALLSLLVSQGVGSVMQNTYADEWNSGPDDPDYIRVYTGLAIQCCFLAGILNLALGILKLGFLTQFLSRAVISGFVSGAAIVIAASQLQHILGVKIPSSSKLHEIIASLIQQLAAGNFNWHSFVLGSCCIVFLVGTKNLAQNERLQAKYKHIKWLRATSPIAVSIVAMVLAYTLDWGNPQGANMRLVGPIPAGLPSITVADWTPLHNDLWVIVISIVVVGFVQSISISKRLGYRRGYEVDPSQELVALGMANLVGSIFQSYPTSGAMGQSAVNDEIGAETGISSIITGLVVMCVLLFMTPAFEYMPLAVLASIVISFVWSMVDYPEAIYLFKVHKFDFAVWIAAFLGTMFLGMIDGLGIAVGISLLIVIWESAYPHTAELGRLPGTMLYRNILQYPEAERYDGLVIVRVDAPIYFANANHVRDKIRRYKRKAEEALQRRRQANADAGNNEIYPGIASSVQYIILELSPVSRVDTTGLHMLEDMYTTQQLLQAQLCLCNPSLEVTARLVQSGFVEKLGRQHMFASVIDAVQWCLHDMDFQRQREEDAEYHVVAASNGDKEAGILPDGHLGMNTTGSQPDVNM